MSASTPGHLRGVSGSSLDAVLSAVEASGDAGEQLGSQLFGVVTTLDSSPALRRVLTDPSTEDEAKRGLASSVFGEAVAASTLDVVRTAVGSRWSAGRDLTDALETAGVVAILAAAAKAGQVDALEDELFSVAGLVTSAPELRSALSDTSVPGAGKADLIGSVLDGKVQPATVAIVRQAARARSASFERTLQRFADLVAARRGRLLAEVRTAHELGQAEHDRLAAALTARYGREVHLNVVVDSSVIGGLAVAVSDDVIDGTMSSRLEAARRQLAG
ncbi:MAG: F0F1 ATP synthase subunit delta [Aeromicrobium sp.]|uniref:F0F1 ATP synthase subunit delta n=1 Tax=Aeromicrobium sp. TaxID=1871063 RepID=UPI002633932E|nr:F0F1 ATP synthase subunit delta [Aeromicrobium sp.]MDF1704085.1 F0F1 ATP synthase subunit delta [Aeromicrobium sp.]